ncbi:MAG TPA: malto-oligosyltrehalose synthase [Gemmatimonadales bacterium]|nr:malto-oligosyltrehalose synthase [Gemmatimonadales bacterium]
MRGPPAAPILATYRLQLNAGFSLAHARELVPYLAALGVTHVHASPVLRAREGSQHGYDVVDPAVLAPALGDEAELERLVGTLRAERMGLVLDIVPNHMAASPENWRWEDVLAHGPSSPYARWFDIEWRVGERELHRRVLLPVLGDYWPRVVRRGELAVKLEQGTLRLRYGDRSFPLDPASYPLVLEPARLVCETDLGAGHPAPQALGAVIDLCRRLPRRTVRTARARERRRRIAGEALRRLRKLCALVPEARRRIERAAIAYAAGEDGAERMKALLEEQGYRLVYWRRAAREINYRRFFDVNDLVSLHMEDPEVFARTHALVLDWIRSGWVDGLRIDHPDGLLDPRGYFDRLADAAFPAAEGPKPVFAEKILSRGERLRDEWPVAGTTGYDFLNQVEALFLHPGGAAEIARDYRRLTRRPMGFAAVARGEKRRVLHAGLSAGVRRLASRLSRLSHRRAAPPVGLHELAAAIVETIVHLPVYRTYVDDRHPEPSPEDRALLESAIAAARAQGRATPRALDLLAGALLGSDPAMRTPEHEGLRRRFVQRFQQVSGPATAKGIEDTAFYVHVPLLSRNEVGGDPDAPLEDAPRLLHRANAHRAACWPRAMLAVTTHDTKRSADVRARLDVLTELADEWEDRVYCWRRWNREHRARGGSRLLPDPNTEYLVYQTLVGAWPLELMAPGRRPPRPPGPPGGAAADDRAALAQFRDRIAAYALKAAREAKEHTSWVDPDEEFERALDDFLRAILSFDTAPEFVDDLAAFASRVSRPGMWNALARTALQLTAPGTPDLYQGDETWNFLLVDPDNRRPVDFERRRVLLGQVADGFRDAAGRVHFLAELVRAPEDGRVKLHVVHRLLETRRAVPSLFAGGGYEALEAIGSAADHLFAFVRRRETAAAVVVVPRLITRRLRVADALPPGREFWAGTRVTLRAGEAQARWRDVLTGGEHAGAVLDAAALFGTLPVAVLLSTGAS